jgi:hypothetical protein
MSLIDWPNHKKVYKLWRLPNIKVFISTSVSPIIMKKEKKNHQREKEGQEMGKNPLK